MRKLRLNGFREWRRYVDYDKNPNNIPSHPEETYKDKWKGWGDFLGTKNKSRIKNRQYLSFNKSRNYARSLNIKSFREWNRYWKTNKKPDNIPFNPYLIYKDKGWTTWPDFLGNK